MPPRTRVSWRQLLRGGTALAALLAGSVVLAVAAAGVLVDSLGTAGAAGSRTIAFGIGALVVPAVLVGTSATVTAGRRSGRLAGTGALLATASVLGWAILGGGVSTQSPGTLILAAGYALGTALPLITLARTVSGTGTRNPSAAKQAGWVAADRQPRRSGSVPADGGSTESDLSFPLEDDEEGEDRSN